MIDVGGAALLGAAARNPAGVAAVVQPGALPPDPRRAAGARAVSPESARKLAAEAFGTVAAYHAEIAAYLNQVTGKNFPSASPWSSRRSSDLRYGENPHQTGGLLPRDDASSGDGRRRDQLQGGAPSFNNLLDLDTAYRIARDFATPTVGDREAHRPGRARLDDELVEAYRHALETDPVAVVRRRSSG